MNDRIKELIKEMGIIPEDEHYEVAELIIQECFDCIDIMKKIAHSTNASIPKDYDKHTYFETLDTMRGLLKTHFGVTP